MNDSDLIRLLRKYPTLWADGFYAGKGDLEQGRLCLMTCLDQINLCIDWLRKYGSIDRLKGRDTHHVKCLIEQETLTYVCNGAAAAAAIWLGFPFKIEGGTGSFPTRKTQRVIEQWPGGVGITILRI